MRAIVRGAVSLLAADGRLDSFAEGAGFPGVGVVGAKGLLSPQSIRGFRAERPRPPAGDLPIFPVGLGLFFHRG